MRYKIFKSELSLRSVCIMANYIHEAQSIITLCDMIIYTYRTVFIRSESIACSASLTMRVSVCYVCMYVHRIVIVIVIIVIVIIVACFVLCFECAEVVFKTRFRFACEFR